MARVNSIVIGMIMLFFVPTKAQFTDDFSDGNLFLDPTWTGNTSLFEISGINQLHLNASPVNGNSFLATKSRAIVNGSWEFWIRTDFNPSSSNYSKVFIAADKSCPDSITCGYFIKAGGTNDDLCFYKINGSTETLLIKGREKMFNTNVVNARVKITRDNAGQWNLFCDTTGLFQYTMVGQVTDNSILKSEYFIIQCIYSATRSDKFYFDDFKVSGEPYTDGSLPFLIKYKITGSNRMDLIFSEAVKNTATCKEMLLLNGNYLPDTIIFSRENPVLVHCAFPSEFFCESDNVLKISCTEDEWGNQISDTAIFFRYCKPELFDIVINEVMADPEPAYHLPESEYIELYNRSNKILRTTDFTMKIGTSTSFLPDTVMLPGEYFIFTSQTNVAGFNKYGKAFGIFSSSSVLNNSGESIILNDNGGNLISFVKYSNVWYDDAFKSNGGWSLEQIDPDNPCTGRMNWKVSQNKSGGTPGKINSVFSENSDYSNPALNRISLSSDTSVLLTFTEPILHKQTLLSDNFKINPDLGELKTVSLSGENYSVIGLKYAHAITPGINYKLQVLNISDCIGNTLSEPIDTFLSIPQKADSLDIIINEVLFNAFPGCPEYIELYNRSGKVLDGSELLISLVDGQVTKTFRISRDKFLFFPLSYLLLSKSPELLGTFYDLKNDYSLQKINDMSALNDYDGYISLLDCGFQIIDAFKYSSSMHLPGLKNTEGISLERVHAFNPSNSEGNWHSAAESSGFGTPGYANSQTISELEGSEEFSTEYILFSPDNDGYHDVLNIPYNFMDAGFHASVIVFNSSGVKVRHLLNNTYLGSSGSLTWDGVSDNGKMCAPGMYLLYIRCVQDKGKVKEYKLPCVLAIKK